MRKYKIAVVPLDGVGKELHPYAIELLQKTQKIVSGFELEFQWYDAGVEYAVNSGKPSEDGFKASMQTADAMFCGSAGHYDVEMAKTSYPGFKIGTVLPRFFRFGMKNHLGLRPLTLMDGLHSRFNHTEMDILVIREIAQGGYKSKGLEINNEIAFDTKIVTRSMIEKACRYAFEQAEIRSALQPFKESTVSVGSLKDESACLDMFADLAEETAPEYPGVRLQLIQLDSLAERLLREPENFDVILCENALGDIISDIGALLAGGMGVMATADVGGITPHFRPNHGSFPRAIGKNIANPIATFETAKLMLETLGDNYNDNALKNAAKLIHATIVSNLTSAGPRTKDIGGCASTSEVADDILTRIETIKFNLFDTSRNNRSAKL